VLSREKIGKTIHLQNKDN